MMVTMPMSKNNKELRILCSDPGSANYGWAYGLIRIHSGSVQYQLIACGKIEHTVRDLKLSVGEQVINYLNEVKGIADKYGAPDIVFAERYQARGLRGNTGEQVNLMLGALAALWPESLNLVIPSTWKNAVNRNVHSPKLNSKNGATALEVLYELLKGLVSAHEIDASMMLIWAGYTAFQVKPFNDRNWNRKTEITKLRNQILKAANKHKPRIKKQRGRKRARKISKRKIA